jgi:hypothetical protein
MPRKIGSIGDQNPIDYGGGPIYSAPGSGGPWIEYFSGLDSYPELDDDEISDFEITRQVERKLPCLIPSHS